MKTWYAFVGAAALMAASAVATAAPLPEQTKPPKRSAPMFLPVIAADVARGEVQFEYHVEMTVPVQVTRIVEKEGRKVPVTATEYRTVVRAENSAMRLDSFNLFTADGKPVARADLAKRMVPGAVMLIAWDGELPEPAYLKLFKPDTVILVAKAKPGEPGGAVYPQKMEPVVPPAEPKKKPIKP